MNLLMSMTEDGVRAMTEKIRLMDIKKIVGKNVDEAVGLLRVGIGHLRNLNKLPYDLNKQLLTIFQTTSVDAFNDIFKFTDINVRMKIMTVNADYLLDTALKAYKEMMALGTWTKNDNKNTFFTNNKKKGGKGGGGQKTCWNCGKPGHHSNACPDPKKQEGQPNQNGKQNANGEGDPAWKKIAPSERKPQVKQVNGKTYHWCAHDGCKRWNLTHVTSNRKQGVGKRGEGESQQGGRGGTPRGNVSSAPESVVAPEYRNRVSFSESIRDADGQVHGGLN